MACLGPLAQRASSGSRTVPHPDLKHGQPRVAGQVPSVHVDLWIGTSSLQVEGWFFGLRFTNTLGGSHPVGRGMRPLSVVPLMERVQPPLNTILAREHPRPTLPTLERPEETLDLAVQPPGPDAAANVRDPAPLVRVSESPAELAPLIADQEPRPRLFTRCRVRDHPDQVLACRPVSEHPEREQLSRVPVQHGRHLKPTPEDSDLGQVDVPHGVRPVRLEELIEVPVLLLHATSDGSDTRRRARSPFLKDPPDRCPADPDPRADHVPRDRPRPELTLRAEPSDLVHRPSHRRVQPVPGRLAEQTRRTALVPQRLLPVPDRVWMQAEPGGGFLGSPASQRSQLQNLRPLFRRELGPPTRRPREPLRAEDREFPLEQHGLGVHMVPLGEQPFHRRRMPERAGPRQPVALGHGDCHRFDQVPQTPLLSGHDRGSRSMSRWP